MIWSFFAFDSAIFASSSFIESYNDWIDSSCPSIWSCSESKISCCCFRRVSASRARSSSSFSSASCARWYHFAASASASRLCFCIRFCDADTSAYACRTLTRSFCMSATACSSTFSGSSRLEITWFTFDFTSRTKRSPRFIAAPPDARWPAGSTAGRPTAGCTAGRPTAAHCDGGAAPARAAACGAYASAAPSSSESERVLTIMGANCAVATTRGGSTILREASASLGR